MGDAVIRRLEGDVIIREAAWLQMTDEQRENARRIICEGLFLKKRSDREKRQWERKRSNPPSPA